MTTETIVVNMLVFDELVKEGKRQLDFFEGLSQLAIKKIEIRRDYIKEESEFKDLNEAAKNTVLNCCILFQNCFIQIK